MTYQDIISQAEKCNISDDVWWEASGGARFSLAGNQAKFTIAIINSKMFYPSASVPSTHIIKPSPKNLDSVPELEALASILAGSLQIPAVKAYVNKLTHDLNIYTTERYDRIVFDSKQTAKRVHTEDLVQALGLNPKEKYEPQISDVLALFRQNNVKDDVINSFVDQVIFNTLIGNADAHAKNYSLIYKDSGVELAPLYDCVPTHVFREFDPSFAMGINDKWNSNEFTVEDFVTEFSKAGVDKDYIEAKIIHLYTGMKNILDNQGNSTKSITAIKNVFKENELLAKQLDNTSSLEDLITEYSEFGVYNLEIESLFKNSER